VEPPQPIVQVPQSFEEEFPGASKLASDCVINLLLTADLILAEMARWLRPDGLQPTTAQVLAIIEGAGEPLPPHVISDRLLVTRGTVTALLDTLEKRGLVRRLPHPDDRRKLLVEITEEAQGLLDTRMPQLHARERDWLTGLAPEDQAALLRALGAIQAQVLALQGEPFPPGAGRHKPATPAPPQEGVDD
jgi:DNA-binding MarR family transcriptional regulator